MNSRFAKKSGWPVWNEIYTLFLGCVKMPVHMGGFLLFTAAGIVVVVVGGGVVEASAPKAYPRVTLTSASTLSGSVVRTLRGGEGLPNMFYLVASSLGHLRSQCSIVCGSSLQRGHRGSAEGSRRLA